uniref:DNA-directed RNA polymerase RpoA/D/Rpb3-type domain-containing protein n=1 Tax=Chaetoceros debilis TaxID=122233 RepID=A0A7S3Q3Z8_9STRA|mmetsp:Transcript_20977/g.30857  ORF Transcript_20977/g.30857 Transcript_20977/m.30857 type:complete len:401 (+) Transcript_20977:73-1275(+)
MSASGGYYDVTESGIHFRHEPPLPTPKDGQEFLERFTKGFKLNILERPSDDELIFEMIGIDVSFANALRRIMIAEVPTVAVEHVYMWNNSSIVHDEVLSHRLGLVPINTDSRLFDEFVGDDDEATDRNTIVFRLTIKCGKSRKEDAKKEAARMMRENGGTEDPDDVGVSVMGQSELDKAAKESAMLYQASSTSNARKIAEAIETPGRPYTRHVYSKDLEWVPQGDQAERFPEGIRPVHEDILLAKLRPGQMIELEAHGRRGYGKDHAKYSPVATASYRLMPRVELVKPVYDELAEELTNLYEPGVFKLVDCGADEAPHRVKAVVHNPYACTMSRNYMRVPELKESVRITRIPNHFIFSIEGVGMMPPGVILSESLRVLQGKCRNLIRLVDETLEADVLTE